MENILIFFSIILINNKQKKKKKDKKEKFNLNILIRNYNFILKSIIIKMLIKFEIGQ